MATLTAYDLISQFINHIYWSELELCPGKKRRCQATNKKNAGRCKREFSNPCDIRDQLARLKKLSPSVYPSDSCEGIKNLVVTILCWQHRVEAKEAVSRWFKSQAELAEDNKSESTQEDETAQRQRHLNTLNHLPAPKTDGTRSDSVGLRPIQHQSEHPTVEIDLDPYECKTYQGRSVSEAIRETLQISDNVTSGILYAYTTPGIPGYLKIGRTGRKVQVRIAEWRRQCGKPITLECTTPVEVPCVLQLERLVATELSPYRYCYRKKCIACLQKHKEWFKVNTAYATAVMHKWHQFLAGEPYERSLFVKGKWTLRPEYRSNAFLEWLCTPLPPDEIRSPETVMAEVRETMDALRRPAVPVTVSAMLLEQSANSSLIEPAEAECFAAGTFSQAEQLARTLVLLYVTAIAQQQLAGMVEAVLVRNRRSFSLPPMSLAGQAVGIGAA
jgi:Meiotically up-regulated gene 113